MQLFIASPAWMIFGLSYVVGTGVENQVIPALISGASALLAAIWLAGNSNRQQAKDRQY